MRDDVAGGVGLHALAERGQIRRTRIVDANRQPQFLDGAPERFVAFVMQVAAAHRIRPHVEAGRTFAGDPSRFFDGERWLLHRQHGRHAQPIRRNAAIRQAPVVVGATHRGQQFRVFELLAQNLAADGWIEHLRVNAVLIHVRQTRFWLEASGTALFVLLHAPCRGFQKLRRMHGIVAVLLGDRLFLHAHAGTAVAHVADARRPLHKGGIDVVHPDVGRLHLVGIGVDDAVAVTHGASLVFCVHVTVVNVLAKPPRFNLASR